MIKQIYLIRGDKTEPYAEFQSRIESYAGKVAARRNISRLSYTITVERPPSVSVIPFKKKKIAAISVRKHDDGFMEEIMKKQGFSGAYAVTEALPVSYAADRPKGIQTPGVCLLTLFRKKKGIDRATFIDRWHNSHTPLSIQYHPLWHYNRNVVERITPETAEPWEGIVEEHMRTRQELLNPFKFFGNPLVIIPRMIKVYADTKSFIDYPTMEPYLVHEFIVKS